MFGWVIIFFSQVRKSSVTSALINFAFALSVLSVGVDITNFTVGNVLEYIVQVFKFVPQFQ